MSPPRTILVQVAPPAGTAVTVQPPGARCVEAVAEQGPAGPPGPTGPIGPPGPTTDMNGDDLPDFTLWLANALV